MAERWSTRPPYCNWAGYTSALRDYCQELLSQSEVQLPEEIPLHSWLSDHESVLRENEYQRDKNALVAYQLLPIFENTPTGWNAIRHLPNSTGFLADYLVDWHASVDSADKPFIERLSSVLGYTTGL